MSVISDCYPPGYKRWIVEQHAVSGRSLEAIAREHNLNFPMVTGWNGAYKQGYYDRYQASPVLSPSLAITATVPARGASPKQRKPRQEYPDSYKHQVIAASLIPGGSLAHAARKYGVLYGTALSWKKPYLAGEYGPPKATSAALPVKAVKRPADPPGPQPGPVTRTAQPALVLDLPNGTVALYGTLDASLVSGIIKALQ